MPAHARRGGAFRVLQVVSPRSMTFWAAAIPGAIALALACYPLTLPNALLGVHSYVGTGYDDGVYLGAAMRLVNGVLPYRDFTFTQPPGIALLMSPVALLGRLVGTADAMALARVLTACVMGANATLAALTMRTRGTVAMAVAGGALAFYPLTVAAGHSLLLEPYLVLICLIAIVVAFRRE